MILNIIQGQLDFKTIENPGDPKFQIGAELYLFFANLESADSAFTQLIQLYKKVSEKQDISNNGTDKTSKFIRDTFQDYSPKAYIELTKKGSSEYKIFFHQ